MTAPRFRWVDADELLVPSDAVPERPGPGEVLVRLWHTRVDERGRLAGWRMSVETHDGRTLVADLPGADDDRSAPLVELDASRELVDLLDRAWREMSRMGRPPGLTTIIKDDQIREVVAAMRRDGVRVTQPAVATRGGWTIDELRGYLRVNRKRWQDFLHT